MKRDTTAERLLELRLSGQMPTVDIAGSPYRAQWSGQVLVLESGTGGRIALDDLALDEEGRNYLCFFHRPTGAPVTIEAGITALPKDTVMLMIPTEPYIDPVGLARQYGLPENYMLDTYPIREGLKAEVVELERTGLGELIRKNLEKKKEAKRRFGNLLKITGNRKTKKGHGKAH